MVWGCIVLGVGVYVFALFLCAPCLDVSDCFGIGCAMLAHYYVLRVTRHTSHIARHTSRKIFSPVTLNPATKTSIPEPLTSKTKPRTALPHTLVPSLVAGNDIGAAGMQSLAPSLLHLTALQQLHLSGKLHDDDF